MSDKVILQYIEIDVPRCGLTYGVYPCTAMVGVTGNFKCHNSPATCQDTDNYSASTVKTVRFAVGTADLPTDIPCITLLESVQIRSQESMPALKLGVRESITCEFKNGLHNDVGFDNYIADRGFNTYLRGTFWGKFFARYPNMQGYPLRYILGEPGQTLSEMETRYYYIEERTGPGSSGKVSIVAKDAIKFLDEKKAQAPLPSNGRLLAGITDADSSLTLTPTGIGDDEYPSSGKGTIGSEIVTYTRSGDTVTLTARGQQATEAEAHDADEVFQVVLSYSSADPADIIDDLIFNYTQTPSTYANLATWQQETSLNYGRLLSADICRPTSVKKLISELVEQVGLHVWTDVVNQKIRLNKLRAKTAALAVTDAIIYPDSFSFNRDEDGRLDQVWVLYGQKNPLLNLTEDGNYKAIYAKLDNDDVKILEDLTLSIKTIRSRWIFTNNRTSATQIADDLLTYFGDTPGTCTFRLPLKYPVSHGSQITIASRVFEDPEGSTAAAKSAVITRLNRRPAFYQVTARLIAFRQTTSLQRNIFIDENATNVNLRNLHDTIYSAPASGDTITVVVATGVIVGSLDIGSWPSNVAITITVNGRLQGYGGGGGVAIVSEGVPIVISASVGGPALYTRYPITLDNQSEIWGGGGGGGPDTPGEANINYGGGGQGYLPGSPGATTEAPGAGAEGGDGGESGAAGDAGSADAGAAGGAAIDGDSYITYTTVGDIQGATIN